MAHSKQDEAAARKFFAHNEIAGSGVASNEVARNRVARKQIAYVNVPYFGAFIAQQADRSLTKGPLSERPLVLLDDEGRVLATDSRASAMGVAHGQIESQVVARCPLALIKPSASYPILETEKTFSERLARFSNRWQPSGLGSAYLDTTGLPGNLLDWCNELAVEVYRMGLMPSIGLTNGKFSSSTAGLSASPGHVLALNPAVQPAFLSQQTSTLLPLGSDALLELRYLGIRTLGQYAGLPSASVIRRWGQAGRVAQLWAQGYDDRPVISPSEQDVLSAYIEFDGVLLDRNILLAAVARKAEKLLRPLRDQLQSVGWLELTVTRADRRVISVKHIFPMPTAAEGSIKQALDRVLGRLEWNGEGATDVSVTLGDIVDAPAQQLTLFDDPSPREKLTSTLDTLATRYGSDAFCMAALIEPDHPLPERRSSWQKFA